MANKKIIPNLSINDEETPFEEEFLERLPIGFRYMIKKETNTIGELYRRVKFSSSSLHKANQYSNYPAFKPLSNILIDIRDLQGEESHE